METAGPVQPQTSSIIQTTPAKDPITCHVLDLTTGRPAPSLSVTLTLLRPLGPSTPFKAITNADGRVTKWQGEEGPSLQEVFDNLAEHPDGKMVWALKFETGQYYGEGNTFFPEVERKLKIAREGYFGIVGDDFYEIRRKDFACKVINGSSSGPRI